MKSFLLPLALFSTLLSWSLPAQADAKVQVGYHANGEANGKFEFPGIPAPSRNDAATDATFTLIDGDMDRNGGALGKLHDGALPGDEDDPANNFFLRGAGARLLVDLGKVTEIGSIQSYSWHPGARGPQVYKLYGSEGSAAGFNAKPEKGAELEKSGWQKVADVDTRKAGPQLGGQYAVSITGNAGALGKFRYLIFEIEPTVSGNTQSNTFYSEIDVTDLHATAKAEPAAAAKANAEAFEIAGTPYRFTLDVSETPELADWARNKLVPVVQQWYPKIVEMLPSEGYVAPQRFSITFLKDMQGVAATSGTRVVGALSWYRKNMEGEGIGSIVHELVHVAQQYRGGGRPPGWLIEGIPDYIRWYLYEPQSHGAEIPPSRAANARYDASYRTSANFLNWVSGKYDKELVRKLNAEMRQGRYKEELWKEITGHTVQELGDEWKAALAQKTAAQ